MVWVNSSPSGSMLARLATMTASTRPQAIEPMISSASATDCSAVLPGVGVMSP